ncbi:hypothetical protein NUACC21_55730 [Scytonema sp. NUACC21]
MQLKPINQQVVAIVRASSGIGRETARKFATKGASLVVSAPPRTRKRLEEFVFAGRWNQPSPLVKSH